MKTFSFEIRGRQLQLMSVNSHEQGPFTRSFDCREKEK